METPHTQDNNMYPHYDIISTICGIPNITEPDRRDILERKINHNICTFLSARTPDISMEFQDLQENPKELQGIPTKSHGIPQNFISKFIEILKEIHEEFHGVTCKFHGIPWI